MKKILFYINTLGHGGAERVMVNLANALVKRNWSVVFVTSFPEKREYVCSCEVKRINLSDERIAGRIKRNLAYTKQLRKVIKQEKPDIVISFMSQPNFRALTATLGLKAKNLISIRNDPNISYPDKLSRFLSKRFYKLADGVVFQTEDAQKWFPESIQKKSRIIMNQVDDRFFNTVYDGERKNIVATGRLMPQKNHKLLIDAFSMISDKINDDLIIYGDGDLREELEAYIAEKNLVGRVKLPGITDDVIGAIKDARLYVLSSDYEGMPNALIEAMALGLPCVSTDCPCGGPRVLLDGLNDNYLVEVGNAKQLADAMCSVLTLSDIDYTAYRSKISARAQMCRGDKVITEWESYINEICMEKEK